MPYFFLTGWLVAGCSGWPWLAWLAGCWRLARGWLAGRRAGLAGLAGRLLAGWVAGCIYYMIMDGWYLMDVGCGLPGFMDMNLTSFWPRFDLVLDLVPVLPLNLHLLYWLYQRKTMNIKCLRRIRGVPTSFYKLNMMFSTNQGTPQDYSSLHQIKAVAHICSLLYTTCTRGNFFCLSFPMECETVDQWVEGFVILGDDQGCLISKKKLNSKTIILYKPLFRRSFFSKPKHLFDKFWVGHECRQTTRCSSNSSWLDDWNNSLPNLEVIM